MRLSVINNLKEIPAAQWNALAGTDIPFLRHEFLSALETHHCVGEATGWTPQHLLAYENEKLIGAVPQYLKTNSYGELVFDWAWAEAYHRSGRHYYPKLVVAIPYTPATGPRLLLLPEADQKAVADNLIQYSIEHAKKLQVSSLHWLFPSDDNRQQLIEHGFMPRLAYQFHWHNQGYKNFDDFLNQLTSSKRKKIRRERKEIAESELKISRLHGNELTEEQWHAVHRHYASTFDRRSGYATLSLNFFLELARSMPRQLLIILAEYKNNPVASAICFRDDHTLYGRHWGCDRYFHHLHFEACYYQGLEYCIEQGLSRFDPGAQGEHKISRGFLPTATWSTHWIADPEFKKAIEGFLHHETQEIQSYILELNSHTPYK